MPQITGASRMLSQIARESETCQLIELSQFTYLTDAVLMPMIGCMALVGAKLGIGDTARVAQRFFFGTLLVITVVTLRTVITCDEAWLVHTSSLATLIIGSLVIPSQTAATV